MKKSCVILAGVVMLALNGLVSCGIAVGTNAVFEDHAVQLLDSAIRYFQTPDSPYGCKLFYESYPQNHETVICRVNGDTVKHQKVSYLWPVSGLFSGVNALLQLTGDSHYRKLLENDILPMVECYYDTLRVPEGFQSYPTLFGQADRYYDDNVWIGLEFLNTYRLTKNKNFLHRSENLWKFLETGYDTTVGGGIYWCEQKRFTKNTCSNAPAVVFALQLYEATGNKDYLNRGIAVYDWVKQTLRDPEDGLYYDNIELGGKIGKAKYAYNSGQMMQAAVLLYRATGKENYLTDARQLAAACADRFMEPTAVGDGLQLKNANVWFAALLLRGYEELYQVDKQPEYIQVYLSTLSRLWEVGRAANGLFVNNRLGEPFRYEKGDKWLLTQGALVEMYARLGRLKLTN